MKQDTYDWCFNTLVTGIGREEEAKDNLLQALAQLNNEIPEKDRDKYSVEELVKMLKKAQGGSRGR